MKDAGSERRKVLIFSYFFPPMNASGAVRVGKMAKYLLEFGWEPVVITPEGAKGHLQTLPVEMDEANVLRTPSFSIADLVTRRSAHDRDLSAGAASGPSYRKTTRGRAFVINTMRLLRPIYTLPGIERLFFEPMGWCRYATAAGLELLRQNKIDVIFSSFSPAVSHLAAARLHRKTGIPWVAEFRDPWALNPYRSKTQPFQFLEERWEKRTMRNCSLLITVSRPLARDLEMLHGRSVSTIPNGFDDEDYSETIPLTPKFIITYTGEIYPGKRDPTPLLRAISELKAEGRISPDKFGVRFFGSNVAETVSPLVEEFGLTEFVGVLGSVPLSESVRRQKESSVLLLLSWNDPRDAGTLTAKIFEYMGAGRPILALAFKGGAIDDLLRESGCGVLSNDVGELKGILMTWMNEFLEGGEVTCHYHPQEEVIKSYTRRAQAGKLAEAFDAIIAQYPAGGQPRGHSRHQSRR